MTCSQHKQCASHGNLDRMCAPTCVKAIFHENHPSTSGGEDAKTQSCLGETQKVQFSAWKVVLHRTFETATSTLWSEAARVGRKIPKTQRFHVQSMFFGPTATPSQKAQSRSLAPTVCRWRLWRFTSDLGDSRLRQCGVSPVFCA